MISDYLQTIHHSMVVFGGKIEEEIEVNRHDYSQIEAEINVILTEFSRIEAIIELFLHNHASFLGD